MQHYSNSKINYFIVTFLLFLSGNLLAQIKINKIEKIEVVFSSVEEIEVNNMLFSDSSSINFQSESLNVVLSDSSSSVNVDCIIHLNKINESQIKFVTLKIGNSEYDASKHSQDFTFDQLQIQNTNLEKTISISISPMKMDPPYYYSVYLYGWDNNLISQYSIQY